MFASPNPDKRLTSSTQQESLTGVVERLTYHSSESGYSVARLKANGHKDLVTIVGSFPNIQAGQTLKLIGLWREHPKFGSQFQVTQYQETKPATLTGIEKYLGSGLIKGVGPVTGVANGWGSTKLSRIIGQRIYPASKDASNLRRSRASISVSF
jgi:exodeoxyribonuclease V alpha subunit